MPDSFFQRFNQYRKVGTFPITEWIHHLRGCAGQKTFWKGMGYYPSHEKEWQHPLKENETVESASINSIFIEDYYRGFNENVDELNPKVNLYFNEKNQNFLVFLRKQVQFLNKLYPLLKENLLFIQTQQRLEVVESIILVDAIIRKIETILFQNFPRKYHWTCEQSLILFKEFVKLKRETNALFAEKNYPLLSSLKASIGIEFLHLFKEYFIPEELISSLLPLLDEPSLEVRLHAINLLGQIGTYSPELEGKLLQLAATEETTDDEKEHRAIVEIVMALGAIRARTEETRNFLRKIVVNSSKQISRLYNLPGAALFALSQIYDGVEDIFLVIDYLKDAYWNLRSISALVLGDLTSYATKIAPYLLDTLSDKEPDVTIAARIALNTFVQRTGEQLIPLLKVHLKTSSISCPIAWILVLNGIQTPEVLIALKKGLNSIEFDNCLLAAEALVLLGRQHSQAIEYLDDVLASIDSSKELAEILEVVLKVIPNNSKINIPSVLNKIYINDQSALFQILETMKHLEVSKELLFKIQRCLNHHSPIIHNKAGELLYYHSKQFRDQESLNSFIYNFSLEATEDYYIFLLKSLHINEKGSKVAKFLLKGLENANSSREIEALLEQFSKMEQKEAVKVLPYVRKELKTFSWRNPSILKSLVHFVDVSPEIISLLIENLNNGKDYLQKEAILSLGKIGKETTTVIPALIRLVQKEDLRLRRTVIEVLGMLKSDVMEVVSVLIGELAQKETSIKLAAIRSLGKIKSPVSLPHLQKFVSEEENQELVIASLYAITAISQEEALPLLIASLYHEEWRVQGIAALLLGTLGKKATSAIAELREQLENEVVEVKSAAYWALGCLEKEAKEAIPDLIENFETENAEVQISSFWALSKISSNDKGLFSNYLNVQSNAPLFTRFAYKILDKLERGKDLNTFGLAIAKNSNFDIQYQAFLSLWELSKRDKNVFTILFEHSQKAQDPNAFDYLFSATLKEFVAKDKAYFDLLLKNIETREGEFSKIAFWLLTKLIKGANGLTKEQKSKIEGLLRDPDTLFGNSSFAEREPLLEFMLEGSMDNPELYSAFQKALKHPNSDIRCASAWSALYLKRFHQEATTVLAGELYNSQKTLSEWESVAFKEIEPIKKHIMENFVRNIIDFPRESKGALEKCMTSEWVYALKQIILYRNYVPDCIAALDTLSLFEPTPEVLEILIRVVSNSFLNSEVQIHTINTLGELGEVSKEAIPYLKKALKKESLRFSAALALIQIESKEPEGLQVMLECLNSKNSSEVRKAEKAIISLGLIPVKGLLTQLNDEENPNLKKQMIQEILEKFLDSLEEGNSQEDHNEDLAKSLNRVPEIIRELILVKNTSLDAYQSATLLLNEFTDSIVKRLKEQTSDIIQQIAFVLMQQLESDEKRRKETSKILVGEITAFESNARLTQLKKLLKAN